MCSNDDEPSWRTKCEEAVKLAYNQHQKIESMHRQITRLTRQVPVVPDVVPVDVPFVAPDDVPVVVTDVVPSKKDILADRLLSYIGFASGRASRDILSYESMSLAMQADEGFTPSEKRRALRWYNIDVTEWTGGDVGNVRALTTQVRAILKKSGMELKRLQDRRGTKNVSTWQLIQPGN
jgi:hypothetical protein